MSLGCSTDSFVNITTRCLPSLDRTIPSSKLTFCRSLYFFSSALNFFFCEVNLALGEKISELVWCHEGTPSRLSKDVTSDDKIRPIRIFNRNGSKEGDTYYGWSMHRQSWARRMGLRIALWPIQ